MTDLSVSPHLLFCYGTLQDEEIMHSVTGQVFPVQPAVLKGHRRFRVCSEPYPGIVPDQFSEVGGLLASGINDAALAALDTFEGDYYRRVRVQVTLAIAGRDWGEPRDCWVYLFDTLRKDLHTNEPWALESFRDQFRVHLQKEPSP